MLTVSEIMSRDVLLVPERTPIQRAAALMTERRIGSLLVTRNDQPVGIVTERDFTRVVGRAMDWRAAVSDIMSSPLYSTRPDADIIEVAHIMAANHIKKMPVINQGKIVGMVTQTDIIAHLFTTIESLESSYAKGEIAGKDFARKFTKVFRGYEPAVEGVTKHWHMRCRACNASFTAEEKDGSVDERCPKCGSTDVEFDKHPPI